MERDGVNYLFFLFNWREWGNPRKHQVIRSRGRDSKVRHKKYESGMLATEPRLDLLRETEESQVKPQDKEL
jgi:hypothetical protein